MPVTGPYVHDEPPATSPAPRRTATVVAMAIASFATAVANL